MLLAIANRDSPKIHECIEKIVLFACEKKKIPKEISLIFFELLFPSSIGGEPFSDYVITVIIEQLINAVITKKAEKITDKDFEFIKTLPESDFENIKKLPDYMHTLITNITYEDIETIRAIKSEMEFLKVLDEQVLSHITKIETN